MTNLQNELANWAEQKAQRIEANDRLDAAREIDHFATFRNKKDAEATAADLSHAGFVVSLARKGLFGVDLQATHSSDLSDSSVRSFLEIVLRAVMTNNGNYDGFGAPVAN